MPNDCAYIVGGKRSPIGKFLGSLSRLTAVELGTQVAKQLVTETGADPQGFDDVFVGQVLQAGCGQNPARQVALGAGIDDEISATTVNKVCGSGLQSAMFADSLIRAGDADLVLAGGIESMSNAPFISRTQRGGNKFGHTELLDEMLYDGLTNVYTGELMGQLGDYTAEKAGVTRAAQDEFAVNSHEKAAAASSSGKFQNEIAPIELPRGKGTFAADETFRADASVESLGGLKAVFGKEGTVTAGNASPLSDGAAMVLLASEAGVKRCNAAPLARVVAHATVGGPPRDLFFTPPKAIRRVCDKAGWTLDQVDFIEMNEAFAAMMVAGVKSLELTGENVNVHGGAIALGHPIGASGARLLVTLVNVLQQNNGKRGIAALCLGGGNSVAMAIEMV